MSWPSSHSLVSRDVARRTARGPITDEAPDTFSENYRRYYIEMIEDIAAWLKGAPVRVLR